jgi:hypothetical protein
VLFNIDLNIVKPGGAQPCASRNPMRVAVAVSLLVHAVILLCLLSPHHIPKSTRWKVVEVYLNTETLPQPPASRQDMPDENVQSLSAENSADKLKKQADSVAQQVVDTNHDEPARRSSLPGLAMPSELPVPLPGRRQLWSFQGGGMVNAQAGYQAQAQQQIGSAVQNQARMARTQYEAYLKIALADLALKSYCKVTLLVGSTPLVDCASEHDARQIHDVIGRFGGIPQIPGDNPPLVIEISSFTDIFPDKHG